MKKLKRQWNKMELWIVYNFPSANTYFFEEEPTRKDIEDLGLDWNEVDIYFDEIHVNSEHIYR